MDPIKNPFSPGAGSPPPELVGREGILEQARVLRERLAARAGYRTVSLEAHEDKSLPLFDEFMLRAMPKLNGA